jgi:hypothetical protein
MQRGLRRSLRSDANTPLLQVEDQLLIPAAAETLGGIQPPRLPFSPWQARGGGDAGGCAGRRCQLLRAWQILLTMQLLLRGRLDMLQRVRMKVYGTQVISRMR